MWWSVGIDGPCVATTRVCRQHPEDRHGDSRFSIHQIRWAYWVVKQNAVRIKQVSTGLEFLALVPFYSMLDKDMGASGGGITFNLDGSVTIKAGDNHEEGTVISVFPGNCTDSEFFMRFLSTPTEPNPNNYIKLSLPGALPQGSKFHFCMKGTRKERNRDECHGTYRSESLFWKSKVLTSWRKQMNLPPRTQELRLWANRLHLYGGDEEMKLLSTANQAIAGLPIPVDQMPAEEQLMLLGLAKDSDEAALMVMGPGERPPPQLYSAPDPTEDPEAEKAMEELALLAAQAQNVISSGNIFLNATRTVLNYTRNFFLHGVLPPSGLDELDDFLLKKIGMIAHCGFEENMRITLGNITDELFCAMRVHLMNESEVNVFCPATARAWEENCHDVEFMNFTAISQVNELAVVSTFRTSIHGMLAKYPHTVDEDREILAAKEKLLNENRADLTWGPITVSAIRLRLRYLNTPFRNYFDVD